MYISIYKYIQVPRCALARALVKTAHRKYPRDSEKITYFWYTRKLKIGAKKCQENAAKSKVFKAFFGWPGWAGFGRVGSRLCPLRLVYFSRGKKWGRKTFFLHNPKRVPRCALARALVKTAHRKYPRDSEQITYFLHTRKLKIGAKKRQKNAAKSIVFKAFCGWPGRAGSGRVGSRLSPLWLVYFQGGKSEDEKLFFYIIQNKTPRVARK